MFDASEFVADSRGNPYPYCRECRNARSARPRRVADAYVTTLRQQADSQDTASRHQQPWTGPELEVVARTDLSAIQKAEMLGRTLWAVRFAIKKVNNRPREQWLAGLAAKRP